MVVRPAEAAKVHEDPGRSVAVLGADEADLQVQEQFGDGGGTRSVRGVEMR